MVRHSLAGEKVEGQKIKISRGRSGYKQRRNKPEQGKNVNKELLQTQP